MDCVLLDDQLYFPDIHDGSVENAVEHRSTENAKTGITHTTDPIRLTSWVMILTDLCNSMGKWSSCCYETFTITSSGSGSGSIPLNLS